MDYTVMRRGWVLLNDKGKVVAEGNKADIEKVSFQKIMAGHTVSSEGAQEALDLEETTD